MRWNIPRFALAMVLVSVTGTVGAQQQSRPFFVKSSYAFAGSACHADGQLAWLNDEGPQTAHVAITVTGELGSNSSVLATSLRTAGELLGGGWEMDPEGSSWAEIVNMETTVNNGNAALVNNSFAPGLEATASAVFEAGGENCAPVSCLLRVATGPVTAACSPPKSSVYALAYTAAEAEGFGSIVLRVEVAGMDVTYHTYGWYMTLDGMVTVDQGLPNAAYVATRTVHPGEEIGAVSKSWYDPTGAQTLEDDLLAKLRMRLSSQWVLYSVEQ